MKNICIFTLYNEKGASSNYRIHMFVDDLRKKFRIRVYKFWNDSYIDKYVSQKSKRKFSIVILYVANTLKRILQILFVAPHYDIVIIQKCMIPHCPVNMISYLRKRKCTIIFDIDDAVYELQHDYSDKIASLSDVVVCGNKELKNHYNKMCKRTIIIPTVDNNEKYIQHKRDTFNEKCIGWIGNSAQISNLDLVISAMNQLMAVHPEVKFKLICDSAYGYDKKIKNMIFCKWDINIYIESMAEFTIGIMPLKDNEFNRGKCGFKLIQYMDLGKPVIASSVGVNEEIVDSCGLMANSTDEWLQAFEKLLFEESIYRSCVSGIESQFLNKYSYKSSLNKWIDCIDEQF